MHLCRSSSNVPCLPSFLEMLQDLHILLTFDNVHNPLPHLNIQNAPNPSAFYIFNFEMCFAPQRRALFPTSQRPKVVRTCGAFNIFTSKCASRHNGMHFFDISTSKSGRGPDVLCTFWLRNLLCATTACTFSTSQFPKVVRTWGGLSFLSCKCASRHHGVQFFHLSSGQRRFSEPTFRPSGATNHWNNTMFCNFPTFSRTWIFFLLRLSLLSSLLFSDSFHLCFSSVHIVGSLTSKLPSNRCMAYCLNATGGIRSQLATWTTV